MIRRPLRLLALAAMLTLTACQSYKAVPFERTLEIKRIGLPTVAVAPQPTAMLASTVGQNFGLVGALIDAGMASERASDLARVLASAKFDARDRLTDELVATLEARGYEVVRVKATRGPEPLAFLKRYPTVEPPVDAYLDVVLKEYGYAAAGIHDSTPYRPYVYTENRLVAPGGKVLMEDHVVYNHIDLGGLVKSQQVTVSPDPEYRYSNFDALKADPERAVEGLDKAVATTAETIGVLLR